ncbi:MULTISPECIES: hypothetical protein [Paenibacillus]|nr:MULTISPECIES: hypothetical protein [Paenibacillus]
MQRLQDHAQIIQKDLIKPAAAGTCSGLFRIFHNIKVLIIYPMGFKPK